MAKKKKKTYIFYMSYGKLITKEEYDNEQTG